ncbi:MAG: SagB family peptide dehydrogenase [Nostoc sp. DedQUE12a]|nr:SagB family peptide dehydrogenase [Nostoc sp. DedQUE12a]
MSYQSFILSFRNGVSLKKESKEEIIVQSEAHNYTLKQLSYGLYSAIQLLACGGATEEHLSNLVLLNGYYQLPLFYYYLKNFNINCLLCHTVTQHNIPLATITPISQDYQFVEKKVYIDKKYILSRFACVHRNLENLILESPLSHAQIILHDWRGAALIAELAKPKNCYELCSKVPEISEASMFAFLQLLLNAEVISVVEANGKIEEEENLTLAQWEFHDLLFHTRSRQGRHTNLYGATYRFLDKINPLPGVKPKISNDVIELYKPDIEKLQEEDLPFTLVLEKRKSIRSYAEKPITDKQISEFLYRSARVREIFKTEYGELTNRPYPSGGGIYELEIYLTVNTCENIPSGLYHYSPVEHQLCKLSDRNKYVETLLLQASISAARTCTPQILITFAARFQRMSWKYNSIAYAAILKHVGVVYQTMYLVATAMNLAPCGLGCGNSDLFAKAAGTDYYAETSVGEFMLGSKPLEQ